MSFVPGARGSALLAFALIAGVPGAAHADPQACVGANERGHALRDKGELIEARSQFLVCAAAGCPGIIVEECADQARKVDAEIPSLVLAATAGGNDITDVVVTIDGVRARTELDARAIPVDPGRHEVRFARADGTERTVSVLARAGEKNRLVRVSFDDAVVPPPGASEAVRPVPIASIVLAGVSAVALGLFTGFAIDGFGRQHDLVDGCAPNCREDDVDAMRRSYLVADISLGTSVVTFGVAAVLFFTRPTVGAGDPRATGLVLSGAF